VVAFGHGSNTLNCVGHADMVDHGIAKGASADKHAGHSAPDNTHQMNCCGLFCLSALPAEIGKVIGGISTGPALFLTPEPRLLSQSPERPDRPPNSLLFV
jgi:hypothetical protein